MTTATDELLSALRSPIEAGVIRVVPDEPLIGQLMKAFPFSGSKIDWNLASAHKGVTETDPGTHRKLQAFFSRQVLEIGGGADAFYLNDGQLEFGLSATLFTFERHLLTLISAPAHHYFVSSDFAWCMAYTMEGDIDFGRSSTVA